MNVSSWKIVLVIGVLLVDLALASCGGGGRREGASKPSWGKEQELVLLADRLEAEAPVIVKFTIQPDSKAKLEAKLKAEVEAEECKGWRDRCKDYFETLWESREVRYVWNCGGGILVDEYPGESAQCAFLHPKEYTVSVIVRVSCAGRARYGAGSQTIRVTGHPLVGIYMGEARGVMEGRVVNQPWLLVIAPTYSNYPEKAVWVDAILYTPDAGAFPPLLPPEGEETVTIYDVGTGEEVVVKHEEAEWEEYPHGGNWGSLQAMPSKLHWDSKTREFYLRVTDIPQFGSYVVLKGGAGEDNNVLEGAFDWEDPELKEEGVPLPAEFRGWHWRLTKLQENVVIYGATTWEVPPQAEIQAEVEPQEIMAQSGESVMLHVTAENSGDTPIIIPIDFLGRQAASVGRGFRPALEFDLQVEPPCKLIAPSIAQRDDPNFWPLSALVILQPHSSCKLDFPFPNLKLRPGKYALVGGRAVLTVRPYLVPINEFAELDSAFAEGERVYAAFTGDYVVREEDCRGRPQLTLWLQFKLRFRAVPVWIPFIVDDALAFRDIYPKDEEKRKKLYADSLLERPTCVELCIRPALNSWECFEDKTYSGQEPISVETTVWVPFVFSGFGKQLKLEEEELYLVVRSRGSEEKVWFDLGVIDLTPH